MQQIDKSKLCKLQNKPGGEDLYILYETRRMASGKIIDIAGIFDTEHDAEQVAECLNNIFSKLDDEIWQLVKPYRVRKVYLRDRRGNIFVNNVAERNSFKYGVDGIFRIKTKNILHKVEWIIAISKSQQNLEKYVKSQYSGGEYELTIIQYQTNDILPTMYFDDYNKALHQKKFQHVMDHLKDIPQAQTKRQNLRRFARENPGVAYSDSSDSEDDTMYKHVTKRSLLHIPTRQKK
jgi:hypothetical protein